MHKIVPFESHLYTEKYVYIHIITVYARMPAKSTAYTVIAWVHIGQLSYINVRFS